MERRWGRTMLAVPAVGLAAAAFAAAAVRRADGKRHSGWRGENYASPPGRELEITSADGTPLRVLVHGEGDDVVFLAHGWVCNRTMFRHQQEYLLKEYKVVTPEFPGFGRTGLAVNGDYGIERMAGDLKTVIDHFDPGRFVLVGHSMGGFISLAFFRLFEEEYRGRLKGMVFINSSGMPLEQGIIMGDLLKKLYPFPLGQVLRASSHLGFIIEPFFHVMKKSLLAYMIVRAIGFGSKPPGDAVLLLRETAINTRTESFFLGAKACIDVRNEDVLPRIDVPVLSIMGSRDILTNLEVNRKTAELVPDARLEVHEGAGHCVLLERHQEVNAEIGGFLREVIVGSERQV